jgi:hypothetical protein
MGHALGLGHLDDLPGPNIMNGTYQGEKTQLSANDVSLIQQIYPTPVVATPPGASALVAAADAGGAPLVRDFDPVTGAQRFAFYAYDPNFHGGVRVALGDVTGDGIADIITAPGPGGGPHVRVFDGRIGTPLTGPLGGFFAYDADFTGGLFVAAGDVNGDGRVDIITGPDAGGGPNVRVFSGLDGSVLANFMAYSPTFSGGVRVAAGDVDGDGHADIVTGAGPGGGPEVRVFSGASGGLVRDFLAYDEVFRGGVYVAAGALEGSQTAAIVTGAGSGGGPNVRIFNGSDATMIASYFAYDPGFTGGVRVAVGAFDSQGHASIVTSPGPSGGPHVRAKDAATLADLDSFFALDPQFTGGVFIAAGR